MRGQHTRGPSARLAGLILGFLLLAGCSPDSKLGDPSDTNLQQIYDAYVQCIQESDGRPPRNEKQLQKYLNEEGDLGAIFRSPHDGEPYVIFWGVPVDEEDEDGDDEGEKHQAKILAHEKTGKEGSRWVLLTNGSVLKMSQEEFDRAPKAKP